MSDFERRYKLLEVSPELVFEMCVQGWTIGGKTSVTCIEGLPEGCTLVNMVSNLFRNNFAMIVYHPSFDVVPIGQDLPSITATFRQAEVLP